jgi:hypothetical protein
MADKVFVKAFSFEGYGETIFGMIFVGTEKQSKSKKGGLRFSVSKAPTVIDYLKPTIAKQVTAEVAKAKKFKKVHELTVK